MPLSLLPRTVCGKAFGRWVICPLKMEREVHLGRGGDWPPQAPSDTHSPNSSSKAEAAGMHTEPWVSQEPDHLSAENIPHISTT